MGINRVRKENETFEEKQQSQRDWAKENGLFNEKWIHPSYDQEEFNIKISQWRMGNLINGTELAEGYTTDQRLQEALRRDWRKQKQNKTNGANWIGASIKLYLQLCDELVNEITLEANFSGRVIEERDDSGVRIATGTERDGLYYIGLFGKWYPYHKFILLEKIAKLKKNWSNRTIGTGDHILAGRLVSQLTQEEMDARNLVIAHTRKDWILNGKADQMAKDVGLTIAYTHDLPITFNGVSI